MSNGDDQHGVRGELEQLFDRWLNAQKTVVKHVGAFVLDATDMTIAGEWSPTNWLERYGKLWTDLAAALKQPSRDGRPQ
ncbi:MAG: hypothetical protein SF182_21990 [Deltaproteobacteria bacterium]|nr:hypothetical protein [Deltaproteobacteria bacterium]